MTVDIYKQAACIVSCMEDLWDRNISMPSKNRLKLSMLIVSLSPKHSGCRITLLKCKFSLHKAE